MTTSPATKAPEIVRPEPSPLTSTLLDHYPPKTITGGFGKRDFAGQGLWPSYNCLDLLTPTTLCPNPHVGEKVFTRAGWVPSFEFAVYGGVECSAIGLDTEDQKAEVARVFERSQAKGVERALLYTRFAEAESDDDFPWDPPESLTPVSGVSLPVALALLEGDAAANYAGLPTIHMPRAAATVLEASGLVVWSGDLAFTKNGSKVAMGGGYDDPTMLRSGLWDLYATGEVYVEQSEEVRQQEIMLPGQIQTLGVDTALSENTVITLAERIFRVGIDCYVAKATGTITSLTDSQGGSSDGSGFGN